MRRGRRRGWWPHRQGAGWLSQILWERAAWYTKIRPPQLLRFLLYYVQVTRRMDSSIVSAGIFI